MTVAEKLKSEYPKIETLFNRDPSDMKRVLMDEPRMPETALINAWVVTEKIDGTNVRVIYEDDEIRFGGKTDNAQMPVPLLDALRPMFNLEDFRTIWPIGDGEIPQIVLYGEGYGPKIQKGGGNYRDTPGFRLFDVAVRGLDGHTQMPKWWWLEWEAVEDVADKLGIPTVPVLNYAASTAQAIELVEHESMVAAIEGDTTILHEGVVARTAPQLYTRRGKRLMWKLKERDIPN